ncbi:MAG: DNA recombination protein RmuC [Chloroflexi bacterium]|nr:MAG: DNA recombination protein RmuC [Chloroflexota bacterium]
MSLTELLFALLLVLIMGGVAAAVALVAGVARRSDAQARELADLRGALAAAGQGHDSSAADVRERLIATQSAFEAMRAALASRERVDDEARQSLRKLEAVIAGSSTRGVAGENILEEALRHLPPEMVVRNHHVRGKVVEFAIRMPGGKVMPIDSKWPSSSALAELAEAACPPERQVVLAQQAEREVEKRVREVAQYIDPNTTTPWALASVPDAAYMVCRHAFAEAHRQHVIIVGYSMTMPYLLALYQMHLQFGRTVDLDNLQAALMDIDRQLTALDDALENRLEKAVKMLSNVFDDGKRITSRIRGSVHGIQTSEHLASSPLRGQVPDGEADRGRGAQHSLLLLEAEEPQSAAAGRP